MPGVILLLVLFQQIGGVKKPSTGSILIATGKSHDPDLKQSVVLLIHSDRDGAIGLILNRPRDKSIYFGGPVALGARALFRSHSKPEHAEHIIGDVYMAASESAIPKDVHARIYAGYVGWSAAQLTDEISLGLWKIAPGNAAVIFDPHPATLWRRYLR